LTITIIIVIVFVGSMFTSGRRVAEDGRKGDLRDGRIRDPKRTQVDASLEHDSRERSSDH